MWGDGAWLGTGLQIPGGAESEDIYSIPKASPAEGPLGRQNDTVGARALSKAAVVLTRGGPCPQGGQSQPPLVAPSTFHHQQSCVCLVPWGEHTGPCPQQSPQILCTKVICSQGSFKR